MSTLLASFEKKVPVAYQTYTLQHGIERIAMRIPLAEAASFEKTFAQSAHASKQELLALVKKHGGKTTENR